MVSTYKLSMLMFPNGGGVSAEQVINRVGDRKLPCGNSFCSIDSGDSAGFMVAVVVRSLRKLHSNLFVIPDSNN